MLEVSDSDAATIRVASADKKAVKLWEVLSGWETRAIASLEPETGNDSTTTGQIRKAPGAINAVTIFPSSGLLFVSQDTTRVGIYFVPKLGLAPRWCSFLDSLTEEMEQTSDQQVYDDFQFITKSQLQEFCADHLIGTPLLRAYMHGYFMDARLYQKLKLAANPFELEDYKKKKVEERIEKGRKMRLQIRRKLPAINADLASKLQEVAESKSKSGEAAKSILADERFSQLFTNPEFAVEALPLPMSKKSANRR